ncbi:GNAT family N-acetyltransferase [Streptomyces mirabilis]
MAELHGSVVGVAEFQLHCDFGHDEGREAHPGEQTFVLTMAVADADRRSGVGRALLTEIARRAQEAGHIFLPLVPQDGDDAASRQAFYQACGLTLYGSDRPGAAWGCPVSKILNADAISSRPLPHQTSPPPCRRHGRGGPADAQPAELAPRRALRGSRPRRARLTGDVHPRGETEAELTFLATRRRMTGRAGPLVLGGRLTASGLRAGRMPEFVASTRRGPLTRGSSASRARLPRRN